MNEKNTTTTTTNYKQNKNPYCTEEIMIKSIEVLYRNKKNIFNRIKTRTKM